MTGRGSLFSFLVCKFGGRVEIEVTYKQGRAAGRQSCKSRRRLPSSLASLSVLCLTRCASIRAQVIPTSSRLATIAVEVGTFEEDEEGASTLLPLSHILSCRNCPHATLFKLPPPQAPGPL